MKILHVTEVEIGGTITVISHLTNYQKTRDEVSIITPGKNESTTITDGIRKIEYIRSGRNFTSLYRLLKTILKSVLHDSPEIVHLHSTFAGIIGRICLLLIRPIRRPTVIYCPHGFSFLMDGSSFRKKTFSIVERMLSHITDSIICVSNYEKASAIKAGISEEIITVIHNGVPEPKNLESLPIISTPYNPQKINVLFAGRLDRAKGYDVALEAMRLIEPKEDIHLTVAGISQDEINKDSLLRNITYKGWLTEDEISSYFREADVLILPSRWEGFPMVVLEAMSHGVPVVASDCTSLSESVSHNSTGYLFKVEDSTELARILSSTTKSHWKELGLRGKAEFKNRFTCEKMTKATEKLYRELTHQAQS